MTSRKRLISIALVLALLFTAFAGCTPSTTTSSSTAESSAAASSAESSEAAESSVAESGESSAAEPSALEPIILDIYVNFTWFWTDKYEGIIPEALTEATGVTLNPTRASDDRQLGVMIASGDLPDLIYTDDMHERLSNDQFCYPWEELISEHAPSFQPSDMAKEIAIANSLDGKYYTILNAFSTEAEWKAAPAGAPTTASLMYRADILEELGNPSMNTLEEYAAVLDTVKEKYPDMAGLALDHTFMFNVFKGWMIDGWNSSLFIEYPDKMVYYTSAPEYRDFLVFANDLYRRGHILADNFAYNDGSQATQLVINNKAFSYSWYAGNTSDQITGMTRANGYENALWLQSEPMVAGAKYYNPAAGWAGTYISKSCKDPGRAIQYMEYMFSEEGQRLSQWGREGTEYTLDEQGIPVFSDEWIAARDDEELFYSKYTPAYYMGISGVTEAVGRASGCSDNALDVMDIIREQLVTVPQCTLLQPLADTDERIIQDQLKDFVKNSEAKVILSQNDEEFEANYTQYMADLEKVGVQQLNDYMTARLLESKQ
ncbi:MAG: extracellular solute-binding protein [Oscillospiraceae bacterium]